MSHPNTPDFMQLFSGFRGAHGVYNIPASVESEGKIKGKAATIKSPVTVELWNKHLMGEQGLGIIPINEDSKCKFGAIDIDQYPLDLQKLNRILDEKNFPLVLCRTKSGGAHLYLFLSEPHNAKAVQGKLREFAALLGYGDCEIYPRQTQILVERGDMGQWINMPYFNGDNTTRYALSQDGKQLTTEQFVKYAYSQIVTPSELDEYKITPKDIAVLTGAPPCLLTLVGRGFPEGTRNNGLFNLGVYAKKVNADNWEEKLMELNTKFMDPPLTMEEVQGVIKSLKKKEYCYSCKSAPLMNHCNMQVCRAAQYGIGQANFGMPQFGSLTKLCTIPPIWFLEVEGGGRLELSTDDLQSPIRFQNKCMESLNIMPSLAKREDWQVIIQRLLADVNTIEVPTESTPRGMLVIHLEEFCTSRVQAKILDEIVLGKPFTNNKRTYFRLKDFVSYLQRQKYSDIRINYISMWLRDLGADKHFFNVKGRGVNCFSIPAFNQLTGSFDPPPQQKESPF